MKLIKLQIESMPRIMYAISSHMVGDEVQHLNNIYTELRYNEKGRMRVKIKGEKEFFVEPGELLIVPANVSYDINYTDGKTNIMCCVAFLQDSGYCKLIDEAKPEFEKSNNVVYVKNEYVYLPICSKVSIKNKTYSYLKQLVRDYDRLEQYGNIREAATLVDLLLAIATDYLPQLCEESPENLSAEFYCKKVEEYIVKYYAFPINMTTFAKYVQLHENYLSALYKKHRGVALMTVLLQTRLEQAKILLEKERYSVSEIAKMVGFTDVNYFISVFKKFEKTTPGKYRKNFFEDREYSYIKY